MLVGVVGYEKVGLPGGQKHIKYTINNYSHSISNLFILVTTLTETEQQKLPLAFLFTSLLYVLFSIKYSLHNMTVYQHELTCELSKC